MTEKIVAIAVIIFCAVRVISYGIYTIKDKNKTGGVSLFVLAAVVLSSSVFFFIE